MAFLSGWTKQIPISIPAAYVTGSIANFPGLIDLSQAPTATRQAIAAGAKSDGSDLRVTLSDGSTVLSHWLRPGTYSNAGGLASGILQPLYPSLTSGVDGSLILQYGNASAPDVSSSSAVFGASGAGYAGAWGFGDGVTLDLTDLTGNGNDGTNYGATAAAGMVGGAANFDGASAIDCGNDDSLGITGAVTLEAWVTTTAVGERYFISKKESTDGSAGYAMFHLGDYLYFGYGTGYSSKDATGFRDGVSHHLAVAWNGALCEFFKDGVSLGTGPAGNPSISAGNVFIGKRNASVLFFTGLLDEPRIAPFAESPAFIYLNWAQVANQSSVVLWGDEVSATTRRRLIRPLIRPLIQYTTGVRA